ncbi:MAG: hypothetical protein E6Q97_16030 [Desulfurellales bacterium]|nr:MAG: hypothetical protein E6Q97_16030 [Desulfurellales bacterium]
MAQYTPQDLHVDQYLTNISIAYQNPLYIADQIFPIVPVNKQSNKIALYDQSHWFRDTAKVRAPGTKSQGGGWAVNSDTYFCDRFSYRHEIDDEARDNADEPFNLDRDATDFVTDKLQMRRERSFAADFFTTSVWGTDKTGASDFTRWSDYAASTPLVDLTTYRDTVEATVGREPNTLVMGKQVWVQLKWHPDVIDTIKYTQRAQVSTDLFASLAEFDRVLVGRSIYTATAEGTAEASVSYGRIWGKHALMVYVPDAPSLLQPAAGYTFTWNRVPGSIQYIRRMRDDEREVDIVEANSYFDQKVTASKAGLFMSTAVA